MIKQRTIPGITRKTPQGGRGRDLELVLERTHKVYAFRKIGSIDKHEREWRYCGLVEYQKLRITAPAIAAMASNGRPLKAIKSIVDFSGVARGMSTYFDAKETQGKSLPLANISEHQTRFLFEKQACGAWAGFLIYFSDLNRFFFLKASYVRDVTTEALVKKGRKSISLAMCEENGTEIFEDKDGVLDWASALFSE